MDAEVAVVGVGTMGSMALWRLARAGISAIGFERWSPGHDQAAAGGESRIFRTAYQDGAYVPLLVRAYELWRELEAESGIGLLTACGCLTIGTPGQADLGRILDTVRTYDLSHEVLDPGALAERYPQFRLRPDETAVLDRRAGVLRPEFAVSAAARRAQELGATVYSGTTVLAVEAAGSGVVIRTAERDYRVGRAILAPGPWLHRLVPSLAPHVRPQRVVLSWYLAPRPEPYRPERFPVFVRYGEDPHLFGLPTLDGGSVKVGLWPQDEPVPDGDPERLDRAVSLDSLATTNAGVADFLPELIPTPIRVSAHLDAFTSDHHGLVGRLPGVDNVLVLGGFSGHGFKLAPLIGEFAAGMITGAGTELDLGRLSTGRFR